MKTLKTTVVIFLCITFSLSLSAYSSTSPEFVYAKEGVSVIFSNDSVLPLEKKQLIADRLVFGYKSGEESISTYSLCWLLGHDLSTEGVIIVDHKVFSTVPRCVEKYYNVETCSNCDYINETLISTNYIYCCPEK